MNTRRWLIVVLSLVALVGVACAPAAKSAATGSTATAATLTANEKIDITLLETNITNTFGISGPWKNQVVFVIPRDATGNRDTLVWIKTVPGQGEILAIIVETQAGQLIFTDIVSPQGRVSVTPTSQSQ
jgi:hypothetical protein